MHISHYLGFVNIKVNTAGTLSVTVHSKNKFKCKPNYFFLFYNIFVFFLCKTVVYSYVDVEF